MRDNGLRPRAIGALSIVAGSLFLLLCLANYGQSGFEMAGDAPLHLAFAGWFVEVFGAGAFALVLLPLVWGLVVYFREDTPSLSMRAAGTLLLACAISMISGLVQQSSAPEMTWAGAVGEYTVALTQGLSGVLGVGFALALAWAAAVTLFMAAMVWATDWWFHSLRKGPWVPVLAERQRIEVEPVHVELRDDEEDDAMQEREFVAMETAGAEAAIALATEPADISSPLPVREVPEGFSVRQTDDRMVIQGPVGYRGVEFLPSSDELAAPAPPEKHYLERVEWIEERFLDDEIAVVADETETETETGDAPVAPIATIEETLGGPIFDDEPDSPWRAVDTDLAAEAIVEALVADTDESATVADDPIDIVTDDVQERPRSGIGLPDDSPFVDEFFAVDVLVSDVIAAGDGASAESEIEAAFGTSIPSSETVADSMGGSSVVGDSEGGDSVGTDAADVAPGFDEAVRSEPAPVATPILPFARNEPVFVNDLLFADAYTVLDDEIPAPIAARSANQLTESNASYAVERGAEPATEPDTEDRGSALERIHDMQLDPLFDEAVDVVLEAGRGSAMSLQRRFGIGHGRGLRLLEQMEAAGILAAEDDAGTRIALVDRATWDTFANSRTA